VFLKYGKIHGGKYVVGASPIDVPNDFDCLLEDLVDMMRELSPE
jgi:hypothetical protein